jgi:hypothetical protein
MPVPFLRPLLSATRDEQRTDRSRDRRRLRPRFEMLEIRLTPTSVTGLSPSSGPVGGGTLVTVSGTGFTGATAVDFGIYAAAIVSVSPTAITAYSPMGAGMTHVTVTTPSGTSSATSADFFGYVATISGISPSSGSLSGDTLVTITGLGFTGATVVDFRQSSGAIASVTATVITAYSPPGSGAVAVSVITQGGPSPPTPAGTFTYVAAPTVSGLSPFVGPSAGGTPVTITGTGFTAATAVDFGSNPATNLDIVNDMTINATSPPGTGLANVTVTTTGGTSSTSPADQFTYAPTISSISPAFGSTAGGTLVTITGTGFTGATGVGFGNQAATIVSIVSSTLITIDSPAGTGSENVFVTTSSGTSVTSPPVQFTYVNLPAVLEVSPSDGPSAGGTIVTITGTGFSAGEAVNFGTSPATNVSGVNATTITAESPPGTGTVNVTVTTSQGASPTSMADQFTYAPTVTSISPALGLTGGGTLVTITGTGFTGATSVDFGTAAATIVSVVSATSITVESPPGSEGVSEPVIVTTPSGPSVTLPPVDFTYVSPPVVSGLSQAFGLSGGGTMVTINGSGFAPSPFTGVDFGVVPAISVTVVSSTTVMAESPPGGGLVNVTVTTPGGTSSTSMADLFTYAPTVTSVSPSVGLPIGGTLVTITGTGFTGATSVDFGTVAATIISVASATSMTVESPPGSGSVDVTAMAPAGTSTTSPADVFTYVVTPTPPSVSALSPHFGPVLGGTLVTITGIGLSGVTAVEFGTEPATHFTPVSNTQITACSPAGTGTANVTVTTAQGTSATSPADQFAYAPVVSSISPAVSPFTGGTPVTITGTGLSDATVVDFGGVMATIVSAVSATSITVDSPAAPAIALTSHASTYAVDVIVTTAFGTSTPVPADLFDYTFAPKVTAMTPVSGPAAGGTVVTITGTGFIGATVVDFGTIPATSLTVVNATTITAITPPDSGLATVTVTTPAGIATAPPAYQFTFVPTVSRISPMAGPQGGGTLVTITGIGFAGATAVNFDSTSVTQFIVLNNYSITVVSPIGTGTVNVAVSTPNATSAALSTDEFTYSPTISGINPAAGPPGGGTLVTITGIGFTGASLVDFGATPAAAFTIVNANTIVATSPSGAGVANVTVTTTVGTSTPSFTDGFTYEVAPTVSGLSATSGRAAGGTTVTITGTGFTAATAVDFGANPATSVSVESDTSLVVQSPAGADSVDVTVTTPGGTSKPTHADQFAYAPSVTGISLPGGPAAGGTWVTITGIGFTGATAVDFGTTPAAAHEIVGDTSIMAESPTEISVGSGSVDLTVTTTAGTSVISPADRFTFAPTVTGLSTIAGPVAGGTTVVITGTNLSDVTAIDFGTVPVTTVVSESETQIVVVSPTAPNVGVVNVTVTTAASMSTSSSADLYFYSFGTTTPPGISGISPRFGAPGGGTLVTITGTGFKPGAPTAVYFGMTAAMDVTVLSTTMITADSPAGTGTAGVAVITPAGPSAISTTDMFTYIVDGPQVLSIQRYGIHFQPTYVVIDFDTALDPSSAQNVANYQIVGPGHHRIKVKWANYIPGMNLVTLVLAQRLNLVSKYRLTINGKTSSGLVNTVGLLDGEYTGEPGSNYSTTVTRSNLAGANSQRPIAAFALKKIGKR